MAPLEGGLTWATVGTADVTAGAETAGADAETEAETAAEEATTGAEETGAEEAAAGVVVLPVEAEAPTILPTPQGILSPLGWVALGSAVSVPPGATIPKRVAQEETPSDPNLNQ